MKRCVRAAHRGEVGRMLAERGLAGEGVEVGVKAGDFSRLILASWPGRLHLVDPWEDQPDCTENFGPAAHALHLEAVFKLAEQFPERVMLHKTRSLEASARLPDMLDFSYIDANHSYRHAWQDMELWFPKLRPGGLLMGHDFMTLAQPDVTQAACEFAWCHQLELWWIAGSPNNEGMDGQVPSFLIVKE